MKVTWELIVISGEVMGIVGLIIAIIALLAMNRKKKELREHMADQSRDDRLRAALGNRYASDQVKDSVGRNVAYHVAYHDDYENKQDAVCVQLTENSSLTTKKYIFYIQNLIRIGNDTQNELVLHEDNGEAYEIQLIREKDQLFAKNCLPGSKVYLQREKKQHLLDERLVRVMDKDRLILKKTAIEVQLLKG